VQKHSTEYKQLTKNCVYEQIISTFSLLGSLHVARSPLQLLKSSRQPVYRLSTFLCDEARNYTAMSGKGKKGFRKGASADNPDRVKGKGDNSKRDRSTIKRYASTAFQRRFAPKRTREF